MTRALKAISGVSEVDVSLLGGQATVQYDESMTSPTQLKSAVTGAGYGVGVKNDVSSSSGKRGCCG